MEESIALAETDRFRIRKITYDDFDVMFAVYGDADAMRWVGDGKAITPESCRRWIEVSKTNYSKRGYGMSAIELRDLHQVIGFCGIVHPNNQTRPEVKYALKREFRGQGFATEAARAMLQFGQTKFGLDQIFATIHSDHQASKRVAMKAGMKHVDSRTEDDGSVTEVYCNRP